ncbi:MAG: glycosyltransferase family 87 protein [Tepidisphaerales bacterium]
MALSLLRHSLRTRFWIGASLLALAIATITAGNIFMPRPRSVGQSMLGYDFLAFYTAGHFLNTGQPENVYDLRALRAYQETEARRWGLELNGTYGPFWNPPFYAWLFRPLARLTFPDALHLWWAINLACCTLALALLSRLLPDQLWKSAGLLVALVVVSLPFSQAFMHGQNTFTSLLVLSMAACLWLAAARKHDRSGVPLDLLAGLVAGLMVYKPQLAMVVAGALAITLGRRAILGMLITGGGLVAASALFSPDLLADWLVRMPANLHRFQETNHYRWERHVTFNGFWRLLLQGHSLGPTSSAVWTLAGLSMLGIGAAIFNALCRARRVLHCPDSTIEQRRTVARRTIAATFLAMPLLMPFYFDYDLLLMAVPGALLAADLMEQRRDVAADRWIVRAWTAFYLWTLLAPGLAGVLRVQLSVPLLAGLTLLQCARVHRRADVVLPATTPEAQPQSLAA